MKSLDNLREWSHRYDNAWVQDDGSVVFTSGGGYFSDGKENYGESIRSMLDEVEAEIAERYMELPLDADGVPVHLGDMLTSSAYVDGEVVGIDCYKVPNGTRYGISVLPAGWDTPTVRDPAVYRHVKPRTIEDVLCDALSDVSCMGDGIKRPFDPTEKYVQDLAAEIREVLGVSE